MIQKLKNHFKRRKADEGSTLEVRKHRSFRENYDQTMEAITFAEAGLQNFVHDTLAQAKTQQRKILVVGNEDFFSKSVMDYAVGFAERMGYEVVALNVLPMATNSPRLSPYCTLVSEHFESKAAKSVTAFHEACEQNGIPFTHVVKCGDLDECIKELHKEIKRIEFVISDPGISPEVAEEQERVVIPVFSMAY